MTMNSVVSASALTQTLPTTSQARAGLYGEGKQVDDGVGTEDEDEDEDKDKDSQCSRGLAH